MNVMSKTEILDKIEALVTLMKIGGITRQRTVELHRFVHMLETEPTIISSNFTDKVLESLDNRAKDSKKINMKGF